MNKEREEQIKQLVQDEIEAEMSWLRCIEMQNEEDVKRAAIELILSRKNSIMKITIREIFGK